MKITNLSLSSIRRRPWTTGRIRRASPLSPPPRWWSPAQWVFSFFIPSKQKRGRIRLHRENKAIVQFLQDLHDMLQSYQPPPIVRPSINDLKPHSKSWLSSFLGANTKSKSALQLPDNLPKGIYMYGDVGSGKTMLMDLFYDTLPSNIKNKTRIHFHNFMQDVHKRMHAIKAQHGDDTDAILFVAADIAAKANVLCFDEFQCTDVADAMILRRSVFLIFFPPSL